LERGWLEEPGLPALPTVRQAVGRGEEVHRAFLKTMDINK